MSTSLGKVFSAAEILDVVDASSLKEIQKTYREQVVKYHPDKNPDPEAGPKTAVLNSAFDVLKTYVRDGGKLPIRSLQRTRATYHRTTVTSPVANASTMHPFFQNLYDELFDKATDFVEELVSEANSFFNAVSRETPFPPPDSQGTIHVTTPAWTKWRKGDPTLAGSINFKNLPPVLGSWYAIEKDDGVQIGERHFALVLL